MDNTEFPAPNTNVGALFVAGSMMLAGFLFLAFLTLKPSKSGDDVAAVFSPTMTLTEIANVISTLPFKLVRTGFSDSIVILRPSEHAELEMLKEAGALFIIDAYANGGCAFFTRKSNKKV